MVVEIPSSALPHSAVLLGRGEEAGSTEGRYSDGGVFHKSLPQFSSSWGTSWGKFRGCSEIHGRSWKIIHLSNPQPMLFSDVLGML